MKRYITTPIYYVNDIPHIGHAYTTIAADVLARYYKSKGDNVFFLTGTDEHGAKIAEAAKKAGKTPKEFADELAPKFENTWKNLNIEYSEFFRTTNPEHEKLVQEFVKNLADKGFVEKRSYEGLYCVGCERYYKESELIDGKKCPDHKTECLKQSEENYFFLLSKLSERLLQKIELGEFQIGPETRKNEVISKVKSGLEDVSISRAAVEWGIPYPSDESQTIYVWIDALLNYYTATKIYDKESPTPTNSPSGRGRAVWPADLHLMAKDILWFHAVIWPAMLIALDLPVPKKVFAHGFFTIDGQKMSKSVGNVIDPNEMAETYGADALRFSLLREFPFGEDGDISVKKIAGHYSDLANTLGNLVQRTISMIVKYQIKPGNPSYTSPSKGEEVVGESPLLLKEGLGVVSEEIESLQFSKALEKIMTLAAEQNQFINENAPWELAKTGNQEKIVGVLNRVYDNLIHIAEAISPFMPEIAEKMKNQLATLTPEPLFPKLDTN